LGLHEGGEARVQRLLNGERELRAFQVGVDCCVLGVGEVQLDARLHLGALVAKRNVLLV
jgi:hypothetical protein